MKTLMNFFTIISLASILASCSVTQPIHVNKNAVGDKKGVSTNTCILSLGYTSGQGARTSLGTAAPTSGGICFNNGDYGIKEAATNGNIDKVATVDLKNTWYVFWREYSLIVTGK